MPDDADLNIAKLAVTVARGSIVAAAGCGKTEQIARATQIAEGRRLILTHTHAGVDALRARLKKLRVPSEKSHIDTIAGWCLRYAGSFPGRSGLVCGTPRTNKEWETVYEAAAKLIHSNAVKGVLETSYTGVFVDEYQDCSGMQHTVIQALAIHLPVCVFGDPLQAIFDFKGQKPVDWDTDVFPFFQMAGELTTPWRWKNSANSEMADWLVGIRAALEGRTAIDLASRPGCVIWDSLPQVPSLRHMKIVGKCKSLLGSSADDRIVVIGDPANINMRAGIAKKLASAGFTNIEPVENKALNDFARKIDYATGTARLECAVSFICACMTGVEETAFCEAVKSCQSGRKRGATNFGDLITTGVAVAGGGDDEALLDLLDGFHRRSKTRLYRKDMYFTMRAALRRRRSSRRDNPLSDAIWEVQNRARHIGRPIGKRSIGSTLLVKGLEFDHAVIIHAESMSRRDWYVALTRATTSVTILSPSEIIPLKDQ